MLIEQLKPAVKAGQKISRHSWQGKILIWFVEQSPREFYITESDSHYTGFVAGKDGIEYECCLDSEALFADDWYVVND